MLTSPSSGNLACTFANVGDNEVELVVELLRFDGQFLNGFTGPLAPSTGRAFGGPLLGTTGFCKITVTSGRVEDVRGSLLIVDGVVVTGLEAS